MKYSILFVFFMVSFNSICQDSFTKSSIIKLNNDTLNGYISNLYDAKKIVFKKTKNSKNQFFGPEQIKGFILNGNTYLSKSVYITNYAINYSLKDYPFIQDGFFLEKRSDFGQYKDSVFVQLIVKGKISVYQLTTNDGAKGIYAERNNKILELPPIHYEFKKDTARGYGYVIQDGIFNRIPNFSGSYTQKKTYLDSLNYLMREEGNYYQSPKNIVVDYDLKTLSAYIKNYNATINQEKNVDVKQFKMKKRIYFGFIYGKIKSNYELAFATKSSTMRTLGSSAISIFALLPYYGANRNMAFRLGYQRYNYDVAVNDKNQQIANFNRKVNSVSLGIRYMVVQGFIRPYIGASVSVMKASTNNIAHAFTVPLLPELGAIVPIKNVNLILQVNMYPFLKDEQHGLRFSTFNVGLML